ncbi:carboxylesterase/lipase family protein [Rhodovarius crocodyli]|nr:carboxylesterase family protein [Rhodovarius crocodyli]
MQRRSLLGGLALPLIPGAALAHAGHRAPVVETTSGRLRGIAGEGVAVFKGIPYADTTAGAHRFLPPQAAPRWAGVREATEYGRNAPQLRGPGVPEFAWYWADLPQGEDALSLSLFTPATDDRRRPVLLWLHGGAFSSGTGSAPGFDGSHLARAQDVVVVSINHRLNLFGHFFTGEPQDGLSPEAGNLGVLDQIAALRWVRDNIERFGGDPGNVTIFGQSGGAAKVTALLATPAAKGLFHRAIVQSASGAWRLATPENAARAAHAVLTELGLTAHEASRLRDVPVDRLLAALGKVGPAEFRPVLDGRVFTQHPYEPAAADTARDVPVLIGWTETEATFFLAGDPGNFTLDAARARARIQRFLRLDEAATDRVIAGYRDLYPEATPSQLLIRVASDQNYRLPTALVADRHAAGGAPTYAYEFNWVSPARQGALGSPHTGEVPFVFGTLDAAQALVAGSPEAPRIRDRLGAIWAGFARTGRPQSEAVADWRPYSAADRNTALLGGEWRVAKDTLARPRELIGALKPFEYSDPVTFIRD